MGRMLRLAVLIALASTVLYPVPGQVARAADARPNIILITADDMAKSDLKWMPETRRLLQANGVDLGNFISNHPLCCPARAEILTGQYAQNNGVHANIGPVGGYGALTQPENHVGAWLQAAGYRTAFVGKHLNQWEGTRHHQPGWTIFDPILKGTYSPNNLTMFNNGAPRLHTGVYTADLMGRLTVKYINQFSQGEVPFFIWTSQVPPHGMLVNGRWQPPVPAPRHAQLYQNALPASLSHPSFNEADVSDKPPYVRAKAKVSRSGVISKHRARIRSLRAVDDQVRATVDALRANGELGNTYVVFTSDNGYLLGEHRLLHKNHAYEGSLRVPMLVRGPGLPRGVARPLAQYGLVDLAPTFTELAGATPGRTMDGTSMMPTLRTGGGGYSHYLIQGSQETNPTEEQPWWWRGVRSARYVYVRYASGFEELYDMSKDRAQLHNVARAPAYQAVRQEYAARLNVLGSCVGVTCRTGGMP